jgi:hypothetical protein
LAHQSWIRELLKTLEFKAIRESRGLFDMGRSELLLTWYGAAVLLGLAPCDRSAPLKMTGWE